MSPRLRHRSATARDARAAGGRRPGLIGLATLLVAVLAGCAGQPFDPSGPCTADGSAPGAYPDLEAAVPTTFDGRGPDDLDSGRACTTAGLGTLATHAVDELRFAGATWERGSDSGVSLAIFTDPNGPALTPAWVAEFYETGARGGKKVESVAAADYPISPTLTARRIDVLNGESFQTIVVYERDGQIAVALVADSIREIQTKAAHDLVVQQAIDAFGDSESRSGG